jgi:hypothetical protein
MSKEKESIRKGTELKEFLEWFNKQDPLLVRGWLSEDLWKNKLDGTEIKRQFLLAQHGYGVPKVITPKP